MSEDNPQSEIDDHERKADEEFGDLEDKADDMDERLEEHEAGDEDVEVPEPDQGESLSISDEE